MATILVSIISYGEKQLRETILDCFDKKSNKNKILFSIVDEQENKLDFCNLDFLKKEEVIYRKFNTINYRGILWARNLTTIVDYKYDYILYICGHTRFAENWDELTIQEYQKCKKKTDKAVLTYCQADFSVTTASNFDINKTYNGRTKNVFHRTRFFG